MTEMAYKPNVSEYEFRISQDGEKANSEMESNREETSSLR